MTTQITCTRVGVYSGALTRGRLYELLAHDELKRHVRICGDNNHTRWYPIDCFDLSGGAAPVLVKWWFPEPGVDELNGWDESSNWITVSFQLSDGEKRWCSFVTPQYLHELLESRSDPAQWGGGNEPGIAGNSMIVVRNLAETTIGWMLHYYDEQGELAERSEPIDSGTAANASELYD